MAGILRQARREDVPQVQVVRMSVRENRLESMVISKKDVIEAIEVTGRDWVIDDEGSIVGFGIANRETRNIWALFLLPEHESKGYGRQLLDEMTNWLWSVGTEPVWLSTDPGTRAESFYKKAGWIVTGSRPNGEVRFEKHRPG